MESNAAPPAEIQLENGLKAILNFETHQASISFSNSCSFPDLQFTIPNSITYQNQEFIVTQINKSLRKILILSNLNFEENCQMKQIDPCAFQLFLFIKNMSIPNSIKNLEGFCGNVRIENISILPNNSHFSVLYNGLIIKNNSQGSVENSEIIFAPRNIQSIAIPPIIKKIGDYSFQNCKQLASVIFITNSDGSSALEEIGNYAFSNCINLRSIILPSTIRNIGVHSFENCNQLTSIQFSEGCQLTKIPDFAFYHCSRIISITIPSSVGQVDRKAFSKCLKLIKVVFQPNENGQSEIEYIDPNSFSYCPKLLAITIPQPNNYFSVLQNGIIIYNKSILFVPRHLNNVVIDNDITSISNYAFQDCRQLNSVVFNVDVVDEIGDYSFMNCNSLTSIILPASIKKIGKCAFLNCKKLQSVVLPDQLVEIGCSAFRECRSLSSISIPSSVTKIHKKAFRYCEELSSVSFVNCQLNEFDDYLFANCTKLESFMIPRTIGKLNKGAFHQCTALHSIELEKDENGQSHLKDVDETSFLGCDKLASFDFHN